MRVWKSSEWLARLIAVILLAGVGTAAADFQVGTVEAQIARQALFITGGLDLGLSAKTEEALSKGIPLEIVIDIGLFAERPLVWNRKITSWTLRYKMRYHALSGQYLVGGPDDDSTHVESFASLQQALKHIGAIEDLSLPISQPLAPGDEKYVIELRASLDIERLPAALRPVAYTSPSWHLNSGWTTWKVQY